MSKTLTIDEMRGCLRNATYRVVFTKANGEEREMKCTTKADLIPKQLDESTSTTKRTHTPGPEQFIVWDLEKNAWRSFNLGSIKVFEQL